MLTQTLFNSRFAIFSWLSKHPQILQTVIIAAITLVFTLLVSGVAYASPSIGGCGSPGC
jgi:hypothetical protein